jgi:hypothetical protein
MSMDETSTTAVTPLLALGDADAAVCADGFCAVPPAKTAPAKTAPAKTAQTGPEQAGADE